MKRFLTCLAATMLLTAALCVSASASDFDTAAQELSAIGMFRGTSDGFELDRAPTRSEAAIMLVRLYGAEDKAKASYDAGELVCPFTDVSSFSAPYVAWLYENGIANGTSATTFGSTQACSAKMYCAFLLRALGYEDGTDFAYADTLTFAQSKGIYDPILFSGDFLRDDLAALTYQALAADTKDGSGYLLANLIADGAVDKGAAQPMTEKIEAYRALAAVQMDETALDANIDLDMDMVMEMEGQKLSIPTVSTGRMQVIYNGGSDVEMAYTMDTKAEAQTITTNVWMQDGWVYISAGSGDEVLRYKYQVADQMQALMSLSGVDMDAMNVSSLALLDSIDVKTSGSDTVYTVKIGKNLGGMMDTIGTLVGTDTASVKIGEISAQYTVGKDGQLKSVAMDFSASMQMEIPMEDGTVTSAAVDYTYDMTIEINATGSNVKITFPDFSGFQEMDPAALAG